MTKFIAVLAFAGFLSYLGAGAASNASENINARNAAMQQALEAAQ